MNLNELWHYNDPVDQWAARREFELRQKRYTLALEGFASVVRRFTKALNEINEVIRGMA